MCTEWGDFGESAKKKKKCQCCVVQHFVFYIYFCLNGFQLNYVQSHLLSSVSYPKYFKYDWNPNSIIQGISDYLKKKNTHNIAFCLTASLLQRNCFLQSEKRGFHIRLCLSELTNTQTNTTDKLYRTGGWSQTSIHCVTGS